MTLLDWLVLGFATWRLSSLLVREAGPFDLFQRLRDRLGVYPTKVGEQIECQAQRAAFGMFCCVWCMSIWVSALLLVLYAAAPVVVWWLAVSALAITVQEGVSRV